MSVTGVCGPVRAADVHLDRLLETAQTQTVRSCEGTGARRHGWLDTRDEDVLEPGFREKGCEGCQGLGRVIFAATRTGQLSRHCLPEFGRCTRAKSTATNAWEGIRAIPKRTVFLTRTEHTSQPRGRSADKKGLLKILSQARHGMLEPCGSPIWRSNHERMLVSVDSHYFLLAWSIRLNKAVFVMPLN